MSTTENTTAPTELTYLKGCTLCNEGSAQEVDSLVKGGLSKKKAYDKISDDVEQLLGYRLFSPASIKKRYLVQTGKTVNNGTPSTPAKPPKDLEEPTNTTTPTDKSAKDLEEPNENTDTDLDTVPRKQYDLKAKAVRNLELQLKAKDDEVLDRVEIEIENRTTELQDEIDRKDTALKHLQDHPRTTTIETPAPTPDPVEILPENTVTKEKYNKLGDSLADLQANYEALQSQLKIQEQAAQELDTLNSMQEADDDQSDYERGFTAGFAEAMNTFSPLPAPSTEKTDATSTN